MALEDFNVRIGSDVYTADGEKVGGVNDLGDGYMVVTKGFLFTSDLFIPLSAVASASDDEVRLNVPKDLIEDMDWSGPPSPSASEGHTFTGTDPAMAGSGYPTDQTSASMTTPAGNADVAVGDHAQSYGAVESGTDPRDSTYSADGNTTPQEERPGAPPTIYSDNWTEEEPAHPDPLVDREGGRMGYETDDPSGAGEPSVTGQNTSPTYESEEALGMETTGHYDDLDSSEKRRS